MKNFQFLRWKKHLARENPMEEEMPSVLNDAVFKATFASNTEDSHEALRFLLCACTNREISDVRVINNELLQAHLNAKSPRLDVHVTFNDGEAAALEMQISKTSDDLKNRAAYYAAMLHSGQSVRGEKYMEIKRAYQIFFLNCILFPESGKLPRRYGYREEKEHDLLTETIEIILYELPKLEQKVYDYLAGKTGTETLSADEKWCIFMKYRYDKMAKPLIEELCRKEEGIMSAEKSLTKVSWNYKRYIRNMAKTKARMEWEARQAMTEEELEQERIEMSRTLEDGFKEYLKREGREEKSFEIARNLLDKGSMPEFVHEITGLDLETIRKMRN